MHQGGQPRGHAPVGHGSGMWIVVHMAKSQKVMQQVRDLLTAEGILVRVKPVYKQLSPDENYYEIQALQSETQEARDVLMDHGY